MRDSYRREIELVPDSEAPGRVVGALARLLTGLRIIGTTETEAWRVTVETGLGSMPAVRRRAFELLLKRDEDVATTDLAVWLGLPNPTTHRVLGDLAAHDVVARISQGQGKAGSVADKGLGGRPLPRSNLFRNVGIPLSY